MIIWMNIHFTDELLDLIFKNSGREFDCPKIRIKFSENDQTRGRHQKHAISLPQLEKMAEIEFWNFWKQRIH